MNTARFFPLQVESLKPNSAAFFGTACALRLFVDGAHKDFVIVGEDAKAIQQFVDAYKIRVKGSINTNLLYQVGVTESHNLKLVDDEL